MIYLTRLSIRFILRKHGDDCCCQNPTLISNCGISFPVLKLG